MQVLSPRPSHARTRAHSLYDVTLDPEQREAALRPAGGAMLVLGEAGHGKTTVALHRLAHLYATSTGRFRAACVVPSEGLARLLQPIVVRLGADVTVSTYDRFARRQARRAFGDLPSREGRSASVAVTRMKRDPALRALLQELSLRPPGVIDDDDDAPPPTTSAQAHRGDLQHLFGDWLWMERLIRASKQGISANAIEQMLEHTKVQFSARSEDAHAHVDRARRVTVDARAIDEGTPDEDAESIDVEDYAVLFELDRLRAERLGAPASRLRTYDCLVVYEAQEFAPLELMLLGRSLARGGTLVVAGDADQQLDPTCCFEGWEASMRAIAAGPYQTVTLRVGHRCPAEAMTLARAVRDGARPSGTAPPVVQFDDEAALREWLAIELATLEEEDEAATKCVVVRTPHLARRIARTLEGRVPRRLVLDGAFVRHRGVDVTTVEHVKGLEWDHVVIADATTEAYPDTAPSRRAMYVAITRARHQVAFAAAGSVSALLG